MAYLIEAVIYTYNNSYFYRPELLKTDPLYDSHLGALTSNLLAIPAIANFLSAFRLGWPGYGLAIVFLAAVEWLFVKLHIYTLHWWRVGYTSMGLAVFFPTAAMLYRRIQRPVRGTMKALFVYLSIGPLSGWFHFLPIMLFECRQYRPGWFEDMARDTSAFAVLHYIAVAVVVTVLAVSRWKHRWMKYALLELFVIVAEFVLRTTGMLRSETWWDPWFYLLFPLGILLAAEGVSGALSEGAGRGEASAE
ncbi:hypothetical protein [Paenibacillus sp.]|uniref:hypothetical protein n=1 Tax=Paenibacillus sp. TaxID=58172 RepID=UPI002D479B5F|nr:hypothetical protein [Paenibacillus sp.]HZG86918.1 hypothetical protein [Paenibacillus sp.]